MSDAPNPPFKLDDLFKPAAPGMSLRDWFAGQALAGLLADSAFNDSPARFGLAAYALADAMLAARAAKKEAE